MGIIVTIQLQTLKSKLWSKISSKTKPGAGWLHSGILSNILRRYNTCFSETLPQKNVEEGILPDSFHKATITLIPKPGMQNTKKENCRPISLVNTDKNIQPSSRKQNSTTHKKLMHHDQVGFISGMQEFFNTYKSINVIHHINKLKGKIYMIISIDAERAFNKIQHPLMIKML